MTQVKPPFAPHVIIGGVAVVCLAGFVAACSSANAGIASVSALAVTVLALFAAVRDKNAGLALARSEGAEAADPLRASLSDLLALVYAWGGLAMAVTYQVSGLKWQHGWQYGLGMLLIGTGIALYARRLRKIPVGPSKDAARSRAVRLVMVQGVAALLGLLWLVFSGKLATPKDDWAANIIFLAGGAAVAGISALIAQLHFALEQNRTQA